MNGLEIFEVIKKQGFWSGCQARIHSTKIFKETLILELALEHFSEKPVCCGELACYNKSFRPSSLSIALETLKSKPGLAYISKLEIHVLAKYPNGFKFLDFPHHEAQTTTVVYNYPE